MPGAFQLDSLHLEVPKGALVGVVGPTGSGKSSLLQAILGRLVPEKLHIDTCIDTKAYSILIVIRTL